MYVRFRFRYFINLAVFLLIILFGVGLLFFTKDTSAAAARGVDLCATVLLPSLFPFFVLSSLVINTGMAHHLGALFRMPMRWLFALPGASAAAFILGIVGGYPVGARTAIAMYDAGSLSKRDTERLLGFCNNCSPAFILGVVGGGVFKSVSVGALLYAAHILSSVIVGIILRTSKNNSKGTSNATALTQQNFGFIKAFISAVSTSFASVLNVCAFVIFFAVAIKIFSLLGVTNFFAVACEKLFFFLPLNQLFFAQLFDGIIEVTSGIWALSAGGISTTSLVSTAFMLGWAGVCVHFQVLTVITQSGLSARVYIFGKLLHGVVSAAITWLFLVFFPNFTTVFSPLVPVLNGTPPTTFSIFSATIALCIGIWLFFALLCKISIVFFGKKLYNI